MAPANEDPFHMSNRPSKLQAEVKQQVSSSSTARIDRRGEVPLLEVAERHPLFLSSPQVVQAPMYQPPRLPLCSSIRGFSIANSLSDFSEADLRAGSISTLWSSAELPFILGSYSRKESKGDYSDPTTTERTRQDSVLRSEATLRPGSCMLSPITRTKRQTATDSSSSDPELMTSSDRGGLSTPTSLDIRLSSSNEHSIRNSQPLSTSTNAYKEPERFSCKSHSLEKRKKDQGGALQASIEVFSAPPDSEMPMTAKEKTVFEQIIYLYKRLKLGSKGGKVSSTGSTNKCSSNQACASYLGQGVILHFNKGSRRYKLRMEYLAYDAFATMLVFGLRGDTPVHPSTSLTLTSLLGESEVVLRQAVLGDGKESVLCRHQAALSASGTGRRQVCGGSSEDGGEATWQLVYAVDECWDVCGQSLPDVKTIRPIAFLCSTAILHEGRPRRYRVANMFKRKRRLPVPMAGLN